MFSKAEEQGGKVFGNYIDLILTYEQAQEKTSTAAPFDVSSWKIVSGCDIQTSSSGEESGFYVSKPAEVQERAKFSLGSVSICGSSDREARKLSEARGRKATMLRSSLERLQQCCCVLVLRIRTSLSGRKKNRRKLGEKVTKRDGRRIFSPVIEWRSIVCCRGHQSRLWPCLETNLDFLPLRRPPASSDRPSTVWSSRSL